MLTPGEVSRLTSIPPSTLRRYAKLFADYLSEGAKRRRRSYTKRDVKVLSTIKHLSSQNIPIEEITTQLGSIIDVDEQEDKEIEQSIELMGVLDKLDIFHSAQSDQATVIEELIDRIDQLEKRTFWDLILRRKPPE